MTEQTKFLDEDGDVACLKIELVLSALIEEEFTAVGLEAAFNLLIKTYVTPICGCEHLPISVMQAGIIDGNASTMYYLEYLGLSHIVTFKSDSDWPAEGFAHIPDARLAVQLYYDNNEKLTDMQAGVSYNQAVLCSLIQLARERTRDAEYDKKQGKLSLN